MEDEEEQGQEERVIRDMPKPLQMTNHSDGSPSRRNTGCPPDDGHDSCFLKVIKLEARKESTGVHHHGAKRCCSHHRAKDSKRAQPVVVVARVRRTGGLFGARAAASSFDCLYEQYEVAQLTEIAPAAAFSKLLLRWTEGRKDDAPWQIPILRSALYYKYSSTCNGTVAKRKNSSDAPCFLPNFGPLSRKE